MIIRNCDELFERPDFSVAADIGWPDMFNSGVFVFTPSLTVYRALLALATSSGSFDDGDQGLLIEYFSNWSDLSSAPVHLQHDSWRILLVPRCLPKIRKNRNRSLHRCSEVMILATVGFWSPQERVLPAMALVQPAEQCVRARDGTSVPEDT